MVKVCYISDSHERNLVTQVPSLQDGGDILIHCGDMTARGHMDSLARFGRELDRLPFRFKVVVAGNHDRCFLNDDREAARREISNHAIYLEDETVELLGLRIYGMPWLPFSARVSPELRGFNLPDTQQAISNIPDTTDILVTHGPPSGIMSISGRGTDIGDPNLTSQVLYRIKPTVHVFGHNHEGHGQEIHGDTRFINASLVDNTYHLRYDPIRSSFLVDREFEVVA